MPELEACNDNGYVTIWEPVQGELKVELAVMAVQCPDTVTEESTNEDIAIEADEAAKRWIIETKDRIDEQEYRLALLQASYYCMRADLLRRQAGCKGESEEVDRFYGGVFGALELRFRRACRAWSRGGRGHATGAFAGLRPKYTTPYDREEVPDEEKGEASGA